MQIDHSGLDFGVTKKPLNSVDGSSSLKHMGCEGVPERVDGGMRDVEFLPCDEQELLEGSHGHGFGGFVHTAE